MAFARTWRRFGRAFFATLAALCLLVLATYVVVCHTAAGRERVRVFALSQLDGVLAGKIEVKEIVRLELWSIELKGVRIQDPTGATVAEADTVSMTFSPRSLTEGALLAEHARVAHAKLDFADFGEQRGLVAAVLPRATAPSPGPPGEPFHLALADVVLEDVQATAALGTDGASLGVAGLHARGHLDLQDRLRIELQSLRTRLLRDGQPVAEIDSARGRYADTDQPAEVHLQGRLAGARVALDAAGGLFNVGSGTAQRMPLEATLDVDRVDADLLRTLGLDTLAARMRGPVRLHARLGGDTREPTLTVLCNAPRGSLEVRAKLDADARLHSTWTARDLVLSDVFADLPDEPLTLQLSAHTPLADAPARVPLEISLAQARLGELELPPLQVHGELREDGVHGLSVRDDAGRVDIEAAVGFDGSVQGRASLQLETAADVPAALRRQLPEGARGSLRLASRFVLRDGHIDADGELHARALGLSGTQVRAIDATFAARGPVTAPVVNVRLSAADLQRGELALQRFDARIEGGPSVYRATVTARSRQARLDAELDVQLERGAVQLGVNAHGSYRDRPFHIRVPQVRIGSDGSIGLSAASIDGLGQHVSGRGRYVRRGASELRIEAAGVDLAALSEALALEPKWSGHVDATLRASGKLPLPKIELEVKGHGLTSAGRPPIDAELTASVDGHAGEASVDVRLDASGSTVRLRGAATLGPAGAGVVERFERAHYDALLELDGVTDALLRAWLPLDEVALAALPKLAAQARIHASGTIDEPLLEAFATAQLRHDRVAQPVSITIDTRYVRGTFDAKLALSDPQGVWVDGQAHLEHPAHDTRSLLRDLPHVARDTSYTMTLAIAERRLSELALPWLLPDSPHAEELRNVTFAGRLSAEHAPNGEPTVRADVTMEAHPASPDADDACRHRQARYTVQATLQDGKLQAKVALLREQQTLLALVASARLRLAAFLDGGAMPSPEDLEVEADATDIDLSSLPVLCKRVSGELSAHIRAQGLLGDDPTVDLRLTADGLSVNRHHMLDVVAIGKLDSTRATIDAALTSGARRSTVSLRLPLRLSEGTPRLVEDGPLSAHVVLDALPLGTLVPDGAAISRVTGTLNGRVDAHGTLRAPRLRGYIEPRGVGFTATALAQPLTRIDGRVTFEEGRVRIDKLTAHDGEGTLTVDGVLERDPNAIARLVLDVAAHEFPLRRQGRTTGELEAKAKIDATFGDDDLRVRVGLKDVSVWLRDQDSSNGMTLDPHPDIVDPRHPALDGDEASAAPKEGLMVISIDADNSLRVARHDFNVKLSLGIAAKVDANGATVKGRVGLHRGYLILLGQVFNLEPRSYIDFVGDTPPDPMLAIEATTENRRSGEHVGVRITGRASQPRIEFSVEGRTVEAAEAAQALFGSAEAGDAAATQAGAFANALTGGILSVAAQRQLGGWMPMVVVEPGTGGTGTRVRAGLELDDFVPAFLEPVIRGVYVEGVFVGGSDDRRQDSQGGVLIELYLPHNLLTSGQYGPGETWTLDFGWEP